MKLNSILLFAIFISFISCATHKNPREIKEDKLDGLKYESLKRYDSNRLSPSLNKQDPLAMCHKARYNEANQIFKQNLDKSLNNYLYWNQISTCYILKKEHNKARNFLNLAMGTAKTNKQKSMILNNIGVIHLEKSKYQEAKDHFKKAIELNKRSLTPKYNLVQIYLKFGLYNKAEKILDQLLRVNKNDVDFLNSMAHLKLMQKKYKMALVYFNKIPVEYRSRDDVATNLGMTYLMLGLHDNAKQTLSNADKSNKAYANSQVEIIDEVERRIKAAEKSAKSN